MQDGKAKLSYTLLLLLHAVPPSILPKGIRAVATLLECKETMRTTEVVAATIMRKIDPALESLEKQLTRHKAQHRIPERRRIACTGWGRKHETSCKKEQKQQAKRYRGPPNALKPR